MSRRGTRLEDLARLAGVSISTASRALNDNPSINSRTKQLIWKLAREHNYAFRGHMPAGPIGATGTIAIVVPRPHSREAQLSDPFYLDLLAGIGDAARERGCDVLVSHFAPVSYEDLAMAMTTSRADGVIFLGQGALHHAFNKLAENEGRFAVWGADLPDQAYCSVGSDNLVGGRRATLHLARLGRRRILYLGDTDSPEVRLRLSGYTEALEQVGIAYDPDLIVPARFDVETAEASIDALLSRGMRFDGIVAASDVIALGAIRALMRGGLSVPDEVSVIGYDDVPFARYSRPALTTIAQDTAYAGRLLVSKLLNAAGEGEMRSDRLPTDLIVRESCGG